MRFGPRKIAAAVALLVLAVALGSLVVVGVLDATGATILVAVAAVAVLVAFVDIRQARRLARTEQRLASRLEAVRDRAERGDAELLRGLLGELQAGEERRQAEREAPDSLPGLVERALRDMEARQTRNLHARTERLETSYDQQRQALERRMEQLGATSAELTRELAKVRERLGGLMRATEHDPRHTLELLQASLALNQELAGQPALPQASSWAAASDLLLYLHRVTDVLQPRRVLECGSGVSSAVIGHALRHTDQQVVSLESDATFADKTRAWAASLGAADRVTVVDAPLVDTEVDGETFRWYDLTHLPDGPPAELLVVDGPWGGLQERSRLPAVACLRDRLAEDVVVVLDDADREDEAAIVERWQELLPDHEVAKLGHAKGTAVLAPAGSIALRLE